MHTNETRYWDFSFQEMAQYDLPAMIDHILARSEHKQIHYVGYSQSTTIAFTAFRYPFSTFIFLPYLLPLILAPFDFGTEVDENQRSPISRSIFRGVTKLKRVQNLKIYFCQNIEPQKAWIV